ncbi:MAG TPA: pentapeptide repeat-containing protein [Edaphocola sp.]|nr:pentapeptide repeat-containing protein [Edaphocola sp.]
MSDIYFYQKTFSKNETLTPGEYESCNFSNLNFSNTQMNNYKFIDCEFDNCDWSMASIKQIVLRDIVFKNCKLLGLHFEEGSPFGLSFSFENCQLSHSSFFKTKIKNTHFKNCKLHEADFTESDLSNANFENCDLKDAIFDRTILEKANFTTAINFSINPETNKIKNARFSSLGLAGLLTQYQIKIE